MAKSTTTTKAKTKTTKKPAAKSASAKTTRPAVKTRAAKTTTKAKTTNKTVATKAKTTTSAAKVETKKTTNRLAGGFNRGFLFAGFIMLVEAVLAGLLMKTDSVQVLLGHLTKNELASGAGTVFAAAAHPLYEIEFRWLLVVLLGVSVVFAVLRGTKWQARETAGVAAGVQPLRWIDFAVTGAILFEIVALLNGVQDAVALKLGMLSVALAAYFAWMYERENAVTGKPARASLIGSQVAAAVPVLALLVTVWGTYIYGIVRSPWYAYAALVVFVVWIGSVIFSLKRTPLASKTGYKAIDRKYNLYSAVAKIVFAAILIVGLYAKK